MLPLLLLLPTASYGMKFLGSMLGYGEVQLQVPQFVKDPSQMRDVDYCAEQIAFTLQQAVDYADNDYIRNYERMRVMQMEVPKKEWRRRPAKVWCKPDDSFDGYIDCHMAMLDFDDKQHSGNIGRFFVISAADKDIEGGFYRTHWDQLVQSLQTYSLAKISSDRAVCLRELFDARPYPLQILSPYHLNKAMFDFLVLRSDGVSQKFYAILVPTMFVSRAQETLDLFEGLVDNTPVIFNRMMMDPTEPYPASCMPKANSPPFLPLIHPKISEEPRDNLGGHLVDVQQALKEFYGRSYGKGQWSCPHTFANRHMMNGALVDEVLAMLSTAAINVGAAELLDCSHPLPVITGSPKSPRTKAVIGSTMFNRVLYRPGLWVAVRGQNCVEARTTGYPQSEGSGYGRSRLETSYIPYAVTTADFYTFDITDNPGLSFQKFHLFKASKGIFMIIIWEENVEMITAHIPQLPMLESQVDFFGGHNNAMPFSNQGRAEFQQLFPNIYPMLEDVSASREQEAVRRYRAEMRRLEDSSIPRPSAPPESPEARSVELKKPERLVKKQFAPVTVNASTSDEEFVDLGALESLEVPRHPIQFPVLNLDIPSRQPVNQKPPQKKEAEKREAVSLL